MIEISPPLAFLFYLGLCLGVILTAWVWHNVQATRRRMVPPEFARIICEYCQHRYVTAADKPCARCPQCQSLNSLAASSDRIR